MYAAKIAPPSNEELSLASSPIRPRIVRIGSRGSPLALRQANMVADLLRAASGGALVGEISTYTTSGDKIQDKPLSEAGGKGLFTKELDRAQELGEIDIAVHSMKDMQTNLAPHLAIGACLEREDPRDVILGPSPTIAGLPEGAVLGTSSLRRAAQALAIRPDLRIVQFRGNVETRLRKLSEGVADATLLAAAGLRRLGLIERATGIVDIGEMLPAACQGIIAITARIDAPDWLTAACDALDNAEARLAALAERAFLRRLDGSCRTPIAAHFMPTVDGAWMAGEVLADDGQSRWRAEAELDFVPAPEEAENLGDALGQEVARARAADLGDDTGDET